MFAKQDTQNAKDIIQALKIAGVTCEFLAGEFPEVTFAETWGFGKHLRDMVKTMSAINDREILVISVGPLE